MLRVEREQRLLLRSELLDDRLGDILHREAAVHRCLLDPAERLGLGQAHLLVQQTLGTIDELAGLEALDHIGDLGLERDDLLVTRKGDLDGGQQVVRGEGLDDVGQCSGLARALDELLLAERREKDDGCDVALVQLLGCACLLYTSPSPRD